MFHRMVDAFRPRIRTLGFLALTLGVVAAGRLALAGGPTGQRAQPPGQSWPEALERFRKLSPAERLRLAQKIGSDTLATHKVARGVLRRDIVERGTLEATHKSEVVCLLKTSPTKNGFVSTIRWVIDDGSFVKKGDKLMELDDSFLQDELKVRMLALQHARAAQDKAQESLKRIRTENEIAARLAAITLRLAELRLKRDSGTDRDRKEELQLKVEQSQLALRRAQARARATEAEAQAELDAKTASVELETRRKDAVAAELSQCLLRAPRDGVVIYYVPEQRRVGGAQQAIVAQGEPVHEGQKLLQIPDLSHMQVNVHVHEALVAHLRNANPLEPRSWQGAQNRVDAFPGRVLAGHVQAVSSRASQTDWLASNVKVYKTLVPIDTPALDLKPGMSAEVRITVQQTTGAVLNVPVSSLVTAGTKRLCFVVTDTEIQEHEVVPGLANDREVEIRSGLKEGDRVLLAPRALIGHLASWLDQKGKRAAGKESS
jgi:multidrug efflux pump subunit AcrA (membrane-fusion protein)